MDIIISFKNYSKNNWLFQLRGRLCCEWLLLFRWCTVQHSSRQIDRTSNGLISSCLLQTIGYSRISSILLLLEYLCQYSYHRRLC